MAPSEVAGDADRVERHTESLSAVRLGDADVLAGVALSAAAGWNQTADDWSLFVRHGRVIGRRTSRSDLVATAATLPFGERLAWISMVLVAPDWQHQGLATELLDECVRHLQATQRVPVLDATPAGEAVYRKLGFAAGFGFARWVGESGAVASAELTMPTSVRVATEAHLTAITAIDHAVGGLERDFLLREFLARQGTRAWLVLANDGTIRGYALLRQGRGAWHIGPVNAAQPEQAIALVTAALLAAREANGRVYLDVPSHQRGVAEWLARIGFTVQRHFTRMALASELPDSVAQPSTRLYAVAGPEYG